jgi:quercetin dioxygenase-like cupin family protein
MNINDKLNSGKEVSTSPIFKGQEGSVTAIQILAGSKLPAHISKIPAMLLCIQGNAVYEDEKEQSIDMTNGNYVLIEPLITHWINAVTDSQFVLIK